MSPSPAPSKGVRKSLIFFAIIFESCLFKVDFDSEFQRFQQENNVLSPTPSTASKAATGQVYSSALVYDPATGL